MRDFLNPQIDATTIQTGTGNLNIKTNLPIIFTKNGTQAMRLFTDATFCFGTTAASSNQTSLITKM